MKNLHAVIRTEKEISIDYMALNGDETTRIVWPISIGLFPEANMLTAWCTKRNDFRHFRIDKIERLQVLDKKFGTRRSMLFAQWKKSPFAMTGDPKKRKNAKISGVWH